MARPGDPNAKIDLLRAAEAVFVERGLDHAKVEDITDRAGRSKGAFYLHFQSKEALFGGLVEAFLKVLAECADRREADMARFFSEHGAVSRRDVEERRAVFVAVGRDHQPESRAFILVSEVLLFVFGLQPAFFGNQPDLQEMNRLRR